MARSSQKHWLSWLTAATAALGMSYGCIAGAPKGLDRDPVDGSGGQFSSSFASSAAGLSSGSSSADPHAIIGVTPAHGPFLGGQQAVVSGRGFDSKVRVWFGDEEAEGVIAIDPTRAQVQVPASAPGVVDVHVQNGDDDSTRRSLISGYTFDALYAVPDSGPVAGGTVIEINGYQTQWDESTTATIDGKPCTTLDALAPSRLRCTVPQGTPGTKNIAVKHASETVTAFDAYTYQDSSDGFKGGLSGAPLNNQLRVFAYNNFTGDALAGAHVIVGSDLATGLYDTTSNTGSVVFNDPTLTDAATVTVTARCHSPITFVDVPVDTVTVYLDPVLSPECASDGDPPPVGGNPTLLGYIKGELVWAGSQEFQKGKWENVPPAIGPDEKRIAYVQFAQFNPDKTFSIPSSSYAVDEQDAGDIGYRFTIPSYPGNHTIYALAGILNTKTQSFSAYAFGVVKGVAVFPGKVTSSVVMSMGIPLDQVLTIKATPPPPTNRGPDRLSASLSIEIAQQRYAILPGMKKMPLLPLTADPMFVGLPPLDGALTGSRYRLGVAAVTSELSLAPLSSVGSAKTHHTSQPLIFENFVALPTLTKPTPGGAWQNQSLKSSFAPGGLPAQLTVFDIIGGGGLSHWTVVAPGAEPDVLLPNLDGFELASLPKGALSIRVYSARIENFDYGTLRSRNLRPAGMDAYALDVFTAFH